MVAWQVPAAALASLQGKETQDFFIWVDLERCTEANLASHVMKEITMGQLGDALKNGNLAAAEKIAQSLQKNRATSPVSAQANANNQQVPSTLAMMRGQGGQIDTLV